MQNSGNTPLTLEYFINGPSYTVLPETYGCGLVLAPGDDCAVYVQYSPLTGGPHIDYLTVSAKEGASVVIKLRGTEDCLQFLSVGFPRSAATRICLRMKSASAGPEVWRHPLWEDKVLFFTITNQNVAGKVTFSTAMTGPSFKVLTAGNTCIAGISAGQSCTMPIEFDPVSVGEHPDTLTVKASSGTTIKVWLCGTASNPE